LHILNFNTKTYSAGAIVIGSLMIIDALMILSGYQIFLNQMFSIIEVFWFIYSLFVLYACFQQKAKMIVPLSYVLFYINSFFFGSFWLAKTGNLASLPGWYALFVMIFAVYYIFVSTKSFKFLSVN